MERWSYDETAAALGTDRAQLLSLLGWRDVLIAELLVVGFVDVQGFEVEGAEVCLLEGRRGATVVYR